MSIKLEVNEDYINSKEAEVNVHYVPATINGDGAANVEKYFSQFTNEEDGILLNALRGYPLKGENCKLPAGYAGIVFQETQKPLHENADRTLKAAGKFSNFTYWNYDKDPSKGDPFQQAMDMIYLSEAISQPVSLEAVKKEMESKNLNK